MVPQIFNVPKWRNYTLDPKSFGSRRTCSKSSITTPSSMGLGFHPPPEQPRMLSFCLCVSVTLVKNGLLNDGICAHDFALKAFE